MHRLRAYLDVAGQPGRYAALDGLRAIAIVLVLVRHAVVAISPYLPKAPDHWLWNLASNGWTGVDLFFVLSGFLISLHLRRAFAQDRSHVLPARYLLKRVLRTFPLYYTVLLLVYAGGFPDYDLVIERPWYELGVHLLFLQDYLGTSILIPMWSLATEEKFYLLAPVLLYAMLRLHSVAGRLLVLAALITLTVMLRAMAFVDTDPWHYAGFFWSVRAPFHCALDGLLLGMVVQELFSAKILTEGLRKHAKYMFILAFVIIASILSLCDWTASEQLSGAVYMIFLSSCLFAIMVWSSLYLEGGMHALLGGVVLRLLAKLSYAMYLTHYALIDFSIQIAGLNEAFSAVSVQLFVFWYLMSTVLASLLLHYLVEKPFLLIKAAI